MSSARTAFHERGFHGTSVDEILARAATTKGGFYHHFEDKRAVAHAVVTEELRELVGGRWGSTDWHDEPITYLQAAVQSMNPAHLRLGCPVNSLAQEVSFHEPGLRDDLGTLFDEWIEAIARGIRAGIQRGTVSSDVDPDRVATYYLAVWEGFVSLAKTRQDGLAFIQLSVGPLVAWLESLRP